MSRYESACQVSKGPLRHMAWRLAVQSSLERYLPSVELWLGEQQGLFLACSFHLPEVALDIFAHRTFLRYHILH